MKHRFLLLALLVSMAHAQYQTTFTKGVYDLTANVKAGLNVWKNLPGGGVCQPNSGSMSYGGKLYFCVGTDNYPYSFNRETHAWTKRTDMGATGMSAFAVRNAHAIYALWHASACPNPDMTLWVFDGANWSLPGGTVKCLSQVSVGSDGFLSGVTQEAGQQNLLWYSQDSGKTWVQWSSGWKYVHMWSADRGCAINNAGALYIVSVNAAAENMGGNFVGCVYGDQPFVLMAWDASGNVSMMDEQNGAWDAVSGLSASHIAGTNKLMVIALDHNNHPYHWNIKATQWSGHTTGKWNSGCPSPSSQCLSTTKHQSNLTVAFSSGHGIGSQKTSIQKVIWNQAMDNTALDISPGCDPMFGTPADPECVVNLEGYETCLQSNQGIGTAQPPDPTRSGISHDYQTAVGIFDRIGPQLDFVSPTGVQYWSGEEQLTMSDGCIPGSFPTCPGPDPFGYFAESLGVDGYNRVLDQLNNGPSLENPFLSEEDWDNSGLGGTVQCLGDQITWGTSGNFDDPNFVPTCD